MAQPSPVHAVRGATVILTLAAVLVVMSRVVTAMPLPLEAPAAEIVAPAPSEGEREEDRWRGNFWRPADSNAARPEAELVGRRWTPERDGAAPRS